MHFLTKIASTINISISGKVNEYPTTKKITIVNIYLVFCIIVVFICHTDTGSSIRRE